MLSSLFLEVNNHGMPQGLIGKKLFWCTFKAVKWLYLNRKHVPVCKSQSFILSQSQSLLKCVIRCTFYHDFEILSTDPVNAVKQAMSQTSLDINPMSKELCLLF